MQVYTVMSGGFGDIVLSCLHPGSDLGYFKAMKARGATTRVELFAHHVGQGFDSLAGNPYVDEVCHTHGLPFNPYKLAAKHAGDYRLLTVADKLVWERPEIYLAAEDGRGAGALIAA